jgi:hypothetical protein
MTGLANLLPLWVAIVVAVALTCALGLLVYWLSNKLISSRGGGIAARVGSTLFPVMVVIIALMLSMAFDAVVKEMRDITNAVKLEAASISDVLESLEGFDSERADDARSALLDYTEGVVDGDWPALTDDELSPDATADFRRAVELVFDLEARVSAREERKRHILNDLDAISDARQARLHAALTQAPIYVFVILIVS